MVKPALYKNLSDILFQGDWILEVNLRRKLLLLLLLSIDVVRLSNPSRLIKKGQQFKWVYTNLTGVYKIN